MSVVFMKMYRRGKNSRMMVLIFTMYFVGMVDGIKEIIVESPFYLRARIYDSQTASILFEIAGENDQRICRMYKFTIRRNNDYPYSMPEQNLTFWRNSLELKHLAVGEYKICAIICSEYLKQSYDQILNHSMPISTCVNIHAYRSHFLILTLYFLVFLILGFSQINFTLRKRKMRALIQTTLIDVENTLQKWRTAQTTDHHHQQQQQSYSILQSLVTLPASPIDHSVVFHLNEESISEIP